MKFTVFVVAVCSVALASAEESADLKAKKAAIGEQCMTELKYGKDVAAILTSKKIPETEAERCLLECTYTKLGLINNGAVSSEGANKLAQQRFVNDKEKVKKADELLVKCLASLNAGSTDEKCKLGKFLRSCFVSNEKELNVFLTKN